ncbi:MAG TPA: type II toxin-antitoxin system RelE/ParE family toxin [Terracidiphilus sp.]|nr:type II toxin-antitoxin system RelE/ParE family toxin [Terracidiphilus sp.]
MSKSAKPIEFRGRALTDLCRFPAAARRKAGYQLYLVQEGFDPDDWKPTSRVGQGVREIRIREKDGAFRVMYVAKFEDAIYVLHCFQKKTQKTSPEDIALASRRYKDFDSGVEPMTKNRYDSVWDAIEKTPAQAENLKLRSSLMLALKRHIERKGLNQAEAAKVFGVTQPRISNLMRGKIDLFGLDMLVNMLAAAGLRVTLQVKKAA